MKKKSINLSGHNTSVLLEEEFWQALEDIAKHQKTTTRQIILHLDYEIPVHPQGRRNLASQIRVYCLNYYRDRVRTTD